MSMHFDEFNLLEMQEWLHTEWQTEKLKIKVKDKKFVVSFNYKGSNKR